MLVACVSHTRCMFEFSLLIGRFRYSVMYTRCVRSVSRQWLRRAARGAVRRDGAACGAWRCAPRWRSVRRAAPCGASLSALRWRGVAPVQSAALQVGAGPIVAGRKACTAMAGARRAHRWLGTRRVPRWRSTRRCRDGGVRCACTARQAVTLARCARRVAASRPSARTVRSVHRVVRAMRWG